MHNFGIMILCFVLLNLQCPPDFDRKKSMSLKLKTHKYCIVNQTLIWKELGGVLLRCIDEDEFDMVITNLHSVAYGRHRYWNMTSFKILRAGYYWLSLFSDAFSKVQSYIECQQFVGR